MPWLAWLWHPHPFHEPDQCRKCVRRGHDGRVYVSLPAPGSKRGWRWVRLDRRVTSRNVRAIKRHIGDAGNGRDNYDGNDDRYRNGSRYGSRYGSRNGSRNDNGGGYGGGYGSRNDNGGGYGGGYGSRRARGSRDDDDY